MPVLKMKKIHFGWTGRGTVGLRSSPVSESDCAHNETERMVISQVYFFTFNTFPAIVDLSRFNNSCLKSPASTLVDLTFQSRALRSFSLNQLRNLSL